MKYSQEQPFPDICTDLFLFALYLRQSPSAGDPGELHDRLANLFVSLEERAKALGASDVDIWDVKYALAAFIDETIGWESRLELEFFGSNVAGEEFFTKLENIKSDKARDGVLAVYYLCIALGFEGRYVRNPEKLKTYVAEYGQSVQVDKLSPHGGRPKEKTARKGGIPAWVPWAFSGIGIVALVATFALLRMQMVDWANGIIGHIQRFM